MQNKWLLYLLGGVVLFALLSKDTDFSNQFDEGDPIMPPLPPEPLVVPTKILSNRKGRVHWESLIREIASQFDLPAAYFFATIRAESNFDPNAMNLTGGDLARGGAFGLGQMTMRTARSLSFTGTAQDLLDPRTNLELVAKLHRANGAPNADPRDVFSRYNSGKSLARAPEVTRLNYVPKVMGFFNAENVA